MNDKTSKSQDHVWFYMHGMFDVKAGPISERELSELIKDRTIKAKTKIFSPTRTQNQIVYAESIPGIKKLLDRIASEKAQAEEKAKLAEAERIAQERKELKERLDAQVEAKRQQRAPAGRPPTITQPNPVHVPMAREDAKTQTIIIQQSAFHPQRIIVLIASLAGMVGIFLPWIQAPIFGSMTGTAGTDGWIMLGFFLPTFAVTLTPDWSRKISFWRSFVACFFLMLNIAFSGWKIWTFWEEQNKPKESGLEEAFSNAVQLGPGLFVILFAAIVAFALLISFPEGKRHLTQIVGQE